MVLSIAHLCSMWRDPQPELGWTLFSNLDYCLLKRFRIAGKRLPDMYDPPYAYFSWFDSIWVHLTRNSICPKHILCPQYWIYILILSLKNWRCDLDCCSQSSGLQHYLDHAFLVPSIYIHSPHELLSDSGLHNIKTKCWIYALTRIRFALGNVHLTISTQSVEGGYP